MKRILSISAIMALFACKAETADITLFYMTTCPHCHKAIEFLDTKMKDVSVEKIEVMNNKDRFLKQLKACNIEQKGVPLMIVKGECIQGFDEKETPEKIKKILAPKVISKPIDNGSSLKK